jgi:hypothetical protein
MGYANNAYLCAQNAVAITTADTDLTNPVRALYVGGNGNIKVTTVDGDVVTFIGCVVGSILPVSVKRVWSTSTTATNIIGLS